jgi:hypothetical protein
MRTQTMIAIGGAAALAVAWLLLSRTPPPPAPVRAPAVVATPAPPVSAPAPIEQPPVPTAPAPVTSPPPPATEPPPAPPVEPEHKAEPAAKDEPPPDGEPDADTAETPSDDEAPADDDSGPAPIDPDHAADLMADWIASEEAAGADDPEKMDHVLKTFDEESAGDPEWSESAEKKVEAVLDEWLAGLPAEIRQHVELLSVECRITLCQILAADNDAATVGEREQHAQEWQQAMALLPQQPWWHELGFVDMTTTMRGNTESGHLLYQTYLMRAAPAPAE